MKRLLVLLFLAATAAAVEPPSRHHPVGVPVPDTMQLPEALQPDEHNRLACATCHGVDDLEELPADEVDPDAPDFLRGGPYPRLERFCFRCHDEKGYRRKNIHLQLDEEGKIRKAACTYCHRKVPDRKQPPENRTQLQLRLPPERLCLGCHLATPHLNALEHSRKPKEKQQRYMEESQQRLQVRLPLDSQGRVTCISCHSPHQKGVLDPDTPGGRQAAQRSVEEGPEYLPSRWAPVFAADKAERLKKLDARLRYRRLAGEVLMRLPARDGTLCKACHTFDD